MLSPAVAVVASKTAVLACGGLVAWYAARAYRRTGSPALRSFAVGLGLIVVGALLAGGVHHLLDASLSIGVAIHSTFTAIGFVTIAYSLYLEGPADSESSTRRPAD